MVETQENNEYEVTIELQLTRQCNYACPFCFSKSLSYDVKEWLKKKILKKKIIEHSDIGEIVSKIERTKKKCLIGISGGEPFLFPGFLELCKKLTDKNHIYITTNLSHKNVYTFAEHIDPSKVRLLLISLHILELEKNNLTQDFVDKIRFLKKRGFKTEIVYVMYPPLFDRFLKEYSFFKSEGIEITPKPFIGTYDSKKYPLSYTEEQKEQISKFLDDDHQALLYNDPNYEGKVCSAGKKMIIINNDGHIYRCWGECDGRLRPLGNILKDEIELFQDATPCRVKHCSCVTDGLNYVIDR